MYTAAVAAPDEPGHAAALGSALEERQRQHKSRRRRERAHEEALGAARAEESEQLQQERVRGGGSDGSGGGSTGSAGSGMGGSLFLSQSGVIHGHEGSVRSVRSDGSGDSGGASGKRGGSSERSGTGESGGSGGASRGSQGSGGGGSGGSGVSGTAFNMLAMLAAAQQGGYVVDDQDALPIEIEMQQRRRPDKHGAEKSQHQEIPFSAASPSPQQPPRPLPPPLPASLGHPSAARSPGPRVQAISESSLATGAGRLSASGGSGPGAAFNLQAMLAAAGREGQETGGEDKILSGGEYSVHDPAS